MEYECIVCGCMYNIKEGYSERYCSSNCLKDINNDI